MINADYNFTLARFHVYEDGKLVRDLEHPFWQRNLSSKYELLGLISLENPDIISFDDSCFIIPMGKIYESLSSLRPGIGEDDNSQILSPELLEFLEIPRIAEGTVLLESSGSFRSQNFRILKSFRPDRNENNDIALTTSPVFRDDRDQWWLLDSKQCEACRLINEHEEFGPRNQEENFRVAAKLRRLAEFNGVEVVRGRLLRENIEDVKSIRPRLRSAADGGIDIGLDIESGNNDEFEELVRSSPKFQDIFTIRGEGTERKRYILSEESKKAITTFRKKSHFTPSEKRLLLDQPEEYLDGFNLDDYSERVVGYGVLYAPQISVFKGEDGTEWVSVDLVSLSPGVGDEQGDIPHASHTFKFDTEKAAEIRKLIDDAEAAGLDSILIDNHEVLITEKLKTAVKKKVEAGAAIGLITKSNIDEVSYQEGQTEIRKPPSDFNISLPEIFSDAYTLKKYQAYGYGWLHWARDNKFSGCLLADDMGMGKTVQICALISFLKEKEELRPSLLVLPLTLMDEWERELAKIVPSVTLFPVRGHIKESDIDVLEMHDMVAITYQAHLKNQKVLGKIHFNLIICDEVQFIKNPASARSQAVLAMNGKFKVASTATPIENSISELWSILDFSNPGYLPPLREFNKKFGERNVSNEEFNANVGELRNELSSIVLRRTKEEFLKDELPSKEMNPSHCLIDEKQVLLCRRIIDDFKHKKSISNFLHFFQKIVMALTNPELLDGEFGVVFPTEYISPKLDFTLKTLRNIKPHGEKVLIFADRKQVQQKLRDAIMKEFGISANIINGETPETTRKQYSASYRPDGIEVNGFDVLILSPRCAGFGLNLVKANHVIHYLRSFNPAVENQATDRVYRIGQNKPVSVYSLIASTTDPELKFTVEQKLDEMIQRKQALLKDYLYTSRVNRISEEELAREIGCENPGFSLADVDGLNYLEFEVFSALLFTKQGYQTSLTPQQDFGADCIAVGNSETANALIQCKKKMVNSKGCVGNKAVQEIVAAKMEYERKMQIPFDELVVITNGYYTEAARLQASSNKVILIDRKKLASLLQRYPVTQSDFDNRLREERDLMQ